MAQKAVNAPLEELTISRRSLRPSDVEFEVLYCGICHSDLHSIKGRLWRALPPACPWTRDTGACDGYRSRRKGLPSGRARLV